MAKPASGIEEATHVILASGPQKHPWPQRNGQQWHWDLQTHPPLQKCPWLMSSTPTHSDDAYKPNIQGHSRGPTTPAPLNPPPPSVAVYCTTQETWDVTEASATPVPQEAAPGAPTAARYQKLWIKQTKNSRASGTTSDRGGRGWKVLILI